MKTKNIKGLTWCGAIGVGLGVAALAALTGCVGYVDPGYVGAVVVPGPDIFIGGYGWGHDAYGYGHRGAASRGAAHGRSGGRR